MTLRISLSNSQSMPAVGYGFWKVERADAPHLTYQSLQLGYRHLDCASDYGNEAEVGDGIQKGLNDGVCKRDDLWVTSKLWNTYHRPEHVELACKRSISDLKCDYLDLYLIHFPITLRYVPFETRYPAGWFFDPNSPAPCLEYDPVPIIDTWRAMEDLVTKGLVRNIGVSNFGVSLIRDLLTQARIRPAVLQIESHPYLTQSKLIRYCQAENIAVTAFSPLGAPSYVPLGMAKPDDSVLELPLVKELASRHQKTAAQIVLKWGVQRGTAVIPKSSRVERLKENLNLGGFELSESEMTTISNLDRNQRFNDPGVFCELAFRSFFPIYE
ncbi:MAG: aldo/keto reductase [Pirellula sp.]|nr:aldo/keto reductase [Pirellula sp.]